MSTDHGTLSGSKTQQVTIPSAMMTDMLMYVITSVAVTIFGNCSAHVDVCQLTHANACFGGELECGRLERVGVPHTYVARKQDDAANNDGDFGQHQDPVGVQPRPDPAARPGVQDGPCVAGSFG